MDEIGLSAKIDFIKIECIDCRQQTFVLRRNELAAVLPINLKTIVLRRVVRSGKDNATMALQRPNRVGKEWGRSQFIEKIHFNTIGGKYVGHGLRKDVAIMSAIISNGNANLLVGKFSF